MTDDEPIEWNTNATYDKETFILTVDMDKYFSNFNDLRRIRFRAMGKDYDVDRKQFIKMLEALEAI